MERSEEKLVEAIKPYLSKARAGDWQHALRVVKWVKELGQNRNDLDLLITAAYIHDIGWSGVAPIGKISFDELLKLEHQANQNSEKLIRQVLLKLEFNDSEIKTIQRLVAAADKHESSLEDEEIIVDADNLSKLCREHLEEKFKPEDFRELIKLWGKEFPKRIKTKKGKELFPDLLEDLKNLYKI